MDKYLGAILGLVVGDALGVPVEFSDRKKLKVTPVTDMRAYGTHHQPAGTWSDDSSMMIATMEWLSEMNGRQPDYNRLMDKYNDWIMHGAYTPYDKTFDFGIATSSALMRYRKGTEPLQCGGQTYYDNGNGSIMRILPVALWCRKDLADEGMKGAEFIYNISALTHAHMISKMGCLIYSKMIVDLLQNPYGDKLNILEESLLTCKRFFENIYDKQMLNERETYGRLWDIYDFQYLNEDDIKSSGYIVDTLEAAVWCFLNTDNYRDCVLKAVNLGSDTDTVGAVAGGLAGLYYGLENIPKEWLDIIPKQEWIVQLASYLQEDGKILNI